LNHEEHEEHEEENRKNLFSSSFPLSRE